MKKKKVRNAYQSILIKFGVRTKGYEFYVWTEPALIWDKRKRKTILNRWKSSYRKVKNGEDVYRFNRRFRKRHIKQDPHCASCHMFVIYENCILDHIKRIKEGGTLDFENTQILCKDCDLDKSNKERGRDYRARKKEQYRKEKKRRIAKFNRKQKIAKWLKTIKKK